MAYKDDTQSQLLLTIGAISGLVVIVLVIGIQAWFMSEEQSEAQLKFGQAVHMQLVQTREKETANINSYRWIDKDKQVAAIPVEQAMKVLIENKGKLPSTQPR